MTADARAGGPADRNPREPADRPAAPTQRSRSPSIPSVGRLLAVDWGTKRIGLAVSDPTRMIAQPLATLTRREGRRFPMQQLRPYLDAYRPVGIVVGLPFEADGTEGPSARAARATAALIAEKSGIPVVLEDERMTTARAARADAVGGRVDRDQRAAALLLQAYLDRARR